MDVILSPDDSFILICPECRMLAFDPKICVNCGAAIPPSTRIKILNQNNKVYEITGYHLKNFSKSTFAFFNETLSSGFEPKEGICPRSDTEPDVKRIHDENCACVKYLKTEDEVKKSYLIAEEEDVVMEELPDEEHEHPAMDHDCAVEEHNSHPVLASNSLVNPAFGGISVNEKDLACLADGKMPKECMTYFKSDTASDVRHTHEDNFAYQKHLKTVSWVLENNFTSGIKDTHGENWARVKHLKTEEEVKRSYLTAKQDEVMEVANEGKEHLAEEHEQAVEEHEHNSHPMSASNSVVHPAIGSVPINDKDIACLADGKMLNDSIIDFYLNYIYFEMIPWEFQVRTHIFSSFFYKFLLRAFHQKSTKNRLDVQKRVNKWIRNVDIFSKDFIFVPINIQRKHWYLAVVCFLTQLNKSSSEENISERSPTATDSKESSDKSYSGDSSPNARKDHPYLDKGKPCICFFDSYDKSSNVKKEEKVVAEILKQFFKMLWKNRSPTEPCDWDNLLYYKAVGPQQDNDVDCGLYLLQYVESFFKNPIPYFGHPMPSLKSWFPKSIMTHKREEIKKVISELKEKQPKTAHSESSCSSDVIVLSTDE